MMFTERMSKQPETWSRVSVLASNSYQTSFWHKVKADDGIIVPQGARHNVFSTGTEPLRLYTIYGPPEHIDGTIHRTCQEANAAHEHFDGKKTELPAAPDIDRLPRPSRPTPIWWREARGMQRQWGLPGPTSDHTAPLS